MTSVTVRICMNPQHGLTRTASHPWYVCLTFLLLLGLQLSPIWPWPWQESTRNTVGSLVLAQGPECLCIPHPVPLSASLGLALYWGCCPCLPVLCSSTCYHSQHYQHCLATSSCATLPPAASGHICRVSQSSRKPFLILTSASCWRRLQAKLFRAPRWGLVWSHAG